MTKKHHHPHQITDGNPNGRPHPLSHFFGCCLGNDPTPISPNIQELRLRLGEGHLENVTITPGEAFSITPDMIVADLIFNFPDIGKYLENLHPLGMMSPQLEQISLEIFLADLPVEIEQICQDLNKLINSPHQ